MLVLATSCTEPDPKQRSYENSIDRAVDSFVFQRPIEQVWPELLSVLQENGFVLHETHPVETRTLMSELNPPGADNGYRALVRVIRIDRKHYKIRIDRQYIASDGEKTIESPNVVGRPTQRLNWALIERAEPARAAKIIDRSN